ncbi:MAG: bifunctional molybdenum cofactor biosynthesis protein MoaC/MoaB [Candidatus Nitrosocosmicus sp.]
MSMIDVGDKPESYRTAIAQALVFFNPNIIGQIKNGNSPKGNVFEAAKISGTLGVKRTAELVPYCHPIPIDGIKVNFEIEHNFIVITVKVNSVWKTGVEMEALTGACVAALTIYDMLKPIDESLSIGSIKVLEKQGGIGDFGETYKRKLNAVVIVVSDSRNEKQDESGKRIINALSNNGFDVVEYKIIPDDIKSIEFELNQFCEKQNIDIIITTGGTGLGPRDVTPDATKNIVEKEIDGIVDSLRMYGQSRTPLSMLSRGIAGIKGNTIIINLPGSPTAVSQSINALFPGIMHAFKMMAGHGHNNNK